MEGPDLKSLAISLLVTGYQTVIPVTVLCMPCKMVCKVVQPFQKWSTPTRLGINLDPLSLNSPNIYMILNPITGLVSPQYYVSFDDFFETIIYHNRENSINPTWKVFTCLDNSSQGKPGQVLHTPISTDTTKQEKNHMISCN